MRLSAEPWEDLRAYTSTYLREEVFAEAIVRRLEVFASFLDLAATKVTEEINYESLASDLGTNPRTTRNFFDVLEDTLIGFRLPPFRLSKQRKAVSRSKFYLFDLGVTNALLQRREVPPRSDAFGRCFEHFLLLELRAYLSYRRRDERLTYWRTHSGFEVDCLVGKTLAMEFKATDLVQERHLKGLKALREEGVIKKFLVVSQDRNARTVDGITILPWQDFLDKLWNDELIP